MTITLIIIGILAYLIMGIVITDLLDQVEGIMLLNKTDEGEVHDVAPFITKLFVTKLGIKFL